MNWIELDTIILYIYLTTCVSLYSSIHFSCTILQNIRSFSTWPDTTPPPCLSPRRTSHNLRNEVQNTKCFSVCVLSQRFCWLHLTCAVLRCVGLLCVSSCKTMTSIYIDKKKEFYNLVSDANAKIYLWHLHCLYLHEWYS